MITLINLVKEGNLIKTNYFSEKNSDDLGYIEYDIAQKEVIKYTYSREDSESFVKFDFSHAIRAIECLIEYNKFPEKYRYIWY